MSPINQRQFIPRIESMRGIAALTVALMHVSNSWAEFPFMETPGRNVLDRLGLSLVHALGNGYGAVVAFFVISGFVLARSLDRNFDIFRFVIARIFRLFPGVIVAIAIFAAIFYGFGFSLYPKASFHPLNVLANMLILRADIDVVMWSMKAEVAATPLIILCVWLFRLYGRWPLVAIAAVLFGFSFVGQFTKSLGDDTNLAPIFAFPVGVLVHFRGRELVEKLTPVAVALCVVASVIAFCTSTFFKPTGNWMLLVECLSAATLVMLIAYRTDAAILRPLDWSVVRFYGRISYRSTTRSIVYAIKQFPDAPVTLIVVTAFIGSLAMITPLAWLSWRFVELPAMNKLRAAPASRSPLPATSG